MCLLDQSAAYDLLCHKNLREKLSVYNFNEAAISWIMSYLEERSQVVQVEASTSNKLECGDHAVSQGLLHVIDSTDFPT